jgi:hypothetical protein
MRHLKTYRIFETSTSLTEEQKGFLNEFTNGSWSLNPQTGKVDVVGSFRCSDQGLLNLRGIEFGNVSGDFLCNWNSLTSLDGAPETVGRNFYCSGNQLTSLEGAPRTVGRSFYCYDNQLTDLKGGPETVGGDFYCDKNNLTSLDGAPQSVGGRFDCTNNKLTDLKGAPRTVGGDFSCHSNKLKSLEGAPKTVGGGFVCDEFVTKNWTLEGKLEILKTGSKAAKSLIATILSPEALQQQIDGNPVRMAVELKGVWKTLKKTPGYEKLKFPPEYSEEAETLADLEDIGL